MQSAYVSKYFFFQERHNMQGFIPAATQNLVHVSQKIFRGFRFHIFHYICLGDISDNSVSCKDIIEDKQN